VRPRLLRALSGRWKLASLHAPAGWGKTTLLSQWCARRDVLWVTATAAERDPAQLLGSLLAGGARLRPAFGAHTLARFHARREFERDGGLLTATFLHELAARSPALAIVVDDAHELAGARATLTWLAGLVERTAPDVRFLFSGRGDPLWPVGQFAPLEERRVDRKALAFDRAESLRMLARAGVPVRERRAIAERQQGWAVGLRAAARAGEDRQATWATLAAAELDALDPRARRDLLLASALDDLEPAPLEALLGARAARALLQSVRRRGLFLDDAGRVPRFHPLFQDVLRDLAARELPPAQRQAAFRRAAAAYMKHGHPVRALALLAASGAVRDAIRGFERASVTRAEDGALASLARVWLADGGPAEAAHSPAVRYQAARADADEGQFGAAAEGACAAAEAWFARRQWLAAARATMLTFRVAIQSGRLQAATRECERLHARLVRTHAAAAALVLARLGALRLHAGDPAAARRDLDRALAVLPARLGVERAEAEMHRATVEFTAGHWAEYLARTRRALEQFRRFGYWGRTHALLVNMAEAYIYLGEEAVARRHLDEAAELAPRSGLHARSMLLELSRARSLSEEGRLVEAGRAFRRARRESKRTSTRLFDAMLDVWEGVWLRRRGRIAHAVRTLERAAASFEALESPAWRNLARLERALAVGLDGDPAGAMRELAACARISRRWGDAKEEARVWLFFARLRQRAGLPHQAALTRALRLLDRENYRVLLRKERDVADPLLASAAGAAGSLRRSPETRRPPPRARAGKEAQATWRVRLLGGFALERGGERAVPARTAAKQLVALLALRHPRPQRREALVEALWPGAPPGAGRNRFDVALHDARRVLDPDAGPRGPFHALRSEGGLVWLDEASEMDFVRFESLAEQAAREGTEAALVRALGYHAGALLPEWPDATWADDARLRVRARAEALLLARARAALAARAPDRALDSAVRVLAEDPLHEEALGWKLRALVALGRRAEAASEATAFEARSRRELDSPPGPELVALVQELGLTRPR
jgi:ATP/maltotriose-dependent transcriptional regulator MalT/DNA-binding SARP family transcriptional activator